MTKININQALSDACMYGNVEVVKTLVEQGADIREDDYAPVRQACRYDHPEVVKFLLEQDANICAGAVFLEACKCDGLKVVKYLVEDYAYGVDIHAGEDDALVEASARRNKELIVYLLKHGADPYAVFERNIFDTTKEFIAGWLKDNERTVHVLIKTCKLGNLDVLKTLANYGIDICAYGEIAFRQACRCGHLEIVQFLIEMGADYVQYSGLGDACVGGSFNVVKFLVEQLGENIHEQYESALEWASKGNHKEIVNYLLERGANPNVVLQSNSVSDRDKDFLRECLEDNQLKSAKKLDRKRKRLSCDKSGNRRTGQPRNVVRARRLAHRLIEHQYGEFEEMHRDFIKFAKCFYGDKFPDNQFTAIISDCVPYSDA